MNSFSLKLHQHITVKVIDIKPFGVFVCLENGSEGYIRRRELSLDGEIAPEKLVIIGQELQVQVVRLAETNTLVELSLRRALQDPWVKFVAEHKRGDVIRGTIRKVTDDTLYVNVAEGITGTVSNIEMAEWPVLNPHDLFWRFDHIEAVITHLSAHPRALVLSIRERMRIRSQAIQFLGHILPVAPNDLSASSRLISEPVLNSLQQNVKVLLLEDNVDILTGLQQQLLRLGYSVNIAQNIEQARMILTTIEINCVIADFNLGRENSLPLLKEIRQSFSQIKVCICSTPNIIYEVADQIAANDIDEVFFKPIRLDEINQFLNGQTSGNIYNPVETKLTQAKLFTPKLSQQSNLQNISFDQTDNDLNLLFDRVLVRLKAKTGAIFELDPIQDLISPVLLAGGLKPNLLEPYDLSRSPVGDIMREGQPVFESMMKDRVAARFKNLLAWLPAGACESCIGFPIEMFNEVRHAVFFFHPDAYAFSRQTFELAMHEVTLLSAYFVHRHTQKQLMMIGPKLMSGEMAGGLSHEINNKVQDLDLTLQNLLHDFKQGIASHSQMQSSIYRSIEIAKDLTNIARLFNEGIILNRSPRYFNINRMIERANQLIQGALQQHNCRVKLYLFSELPSIYGDEVGLQQAYLNIILNASQHIQLKCKKFSWKGERLIEVATTYITEKNSILLSIIDNGTGIHARLFERVFTSGFSTRGGSGLGLTLARQFINTFGGQIQISESFIPIGSVFHIYLPMREANRDIEI